MKWRKSEMKTLFREARRLLRCLCLLNRCDVGDVLRPSNGKFIYDEMFCRDISSAKTVDSMFGACLPDRIKIDTFDVLENIHADWRNTNSENGIGILKVFGGCIPEWGSKGRQCGKDGLCIVWPPVNEDIQIFGCTRLSMNRYRMTAHNDIPHTMSVQSGQEFF